MGADMLLADALRQGEGHALGEPARVYEHKRRAVRLDQLREFVVRVAPLFGGGDSFQVGGRYADAQIEVALVAGVDDHAVGSPVRGDMFAADEELGGVLDGLHGGGEADACRAGLADVVEARQGEGKMAPALVADKGVNLVDDDGANVTQDLAAALGSNHQVEGFRGRDEDMRRVPYDLLPLMLGGVAGAEGGADPYLRETHLFGDFGDTLQGLLQVAADVAAQRLQGRDVDDGDGVDYMPP